MVPLKARWSCGCDGEDKTRSGEGKGDSNGDGEGATNKSWSFLTTSVESSGGKGGGVARSREGSLRVG